MGKLKFKKGEMVRDIYTGALYEVVRYDRGYKKYVLKNLLDDDFRWYDYIETSALKREVK